MTSIYTYHPSQNYTECYSKLKMWKRSTISESNKPAFEESLRKVKSLLCAIPSDLAREQIERLEHKLYSVLSLHMQFEEPWSHWFIKGLLQSTAHHKSASRTTIYYDLNICFELLKLNHNNEEKKTLNWICSRIFKTMNLRNHGLRANSLIQTEKNKLVASEKVACKLKQLSNTFSKLTQKDSPLVDPNVLQKLVKDVNHLLDTYKFMDSQSVYLIELKLIELLFKYNELSSIHPCFKLFSEKLNESSDKPTFLINHELVFKSLIKGENFNRIDRQFIQYINHLINNIDHSEIKNLIKDENKDFMEKSVLNKPLDTQFSTEEQEIGEFLSTLPNKVTPLKRLMYNGPKPERGYFGNYYKYTLRDILSPDISSYHSIRFTKKKRVSQKNETSNIIS
ncbi:MAG: hypothetical protein JHC93_04260 [Parachlamydiales bacterium]|nr:hypothetical protein [Parachlamydiales bacterium]